MTYTPTEAASVLKCSPDHVRALCASGRLAAVNVGLGPRRAKWVISQAAIDAFLSPAISKSETRRPRRSAQRKWI
ncbi:helix-turn-helix domain-containing protein [Neorhodopirellula pilleata]|uniref:Helix-turn-helix domain protein n=1 Tax=Neorhodopirellula pilleata TaxID=2714738 RepID=A0A5C5ZX03_9BACT|nr:Helix-turn-helix domain protein [Neorhodopirellula pilleata]